MLENQYLVNRPSPNRWGSVVTSIAKYALWILLIVWLFSWVQERDRAHFEEVKGLKNIVAIQARVVSDISCAPSIELMHPLGKKAK